VGCAVAASCTRSGTSGGRPQGISRQHDCPAVRRGLGRGTASQGRFGSGRTKRAPVPVAPPRYTTPAPIAGSRRHPPAVAATGRGDGAGSITHRNASWRSSGQGVGFPPTHVPVSCPHTTSPDAPNCPSRSVRAFDLPACRSWCMPPAPCPVDVTAHIIDWRVRERSRVHYAGSEGNAVTR